MRIEQINSPALAFMYAGDVYWLFDETCFCPRLHGYVGITKDLKERIAAHRRTRKRPFKIAVLFSGPIGECAMLEKTLRPHKGIGWNASTGGAHNTTHLTRSGRPLDAIAMRKRSITRVKAQNARRGR